MHIPFVTIRTGSGGTAIPGCVVPLPRHFSHDTSSKISPPRPGLGVDPPGADRPLFRTPPGFALSSPHHRGTRAAPIPRAWITKRTHFRIPTERNRNSSCARPTNPSRFRSSGTPHHEEGATPQTHANCTPMSATHSPKATSAPVGFVPQTQRPHPASPAQSAELRGSSPVNSFVSAAHPPKSRRIVHRRPSASSRHPQITKRT